MSGDNQKEEFVYSPCLGVCVIDDDEMCIGCFRLLTEIQWWPTFDQKERKHIVDACSERKKEYWKNIYK